MTPSTTKTCLTCAYKKWLADEEVCTHPLFARSPSEVLPVQTAFRICEGRKWAEREDEE